MQQERGLFEAIQDHPDDDLPRLAWADWLEDQGRQHQADFVRSQVEWARLGSDHPRRDLLEDQADDLLSEHGAEWAGRLGEIALEYRWDRGCIEHLTLWSDTLLTHGDELFQNMPIRALRVLSDGDDFARLADQPWLTRVERLDLSLTREESAYSGVYFRDDALLPLFKSLLLDRLTELELGGQGLEGPAIAALVESGLFSRLSRLDLGENRALGDRAVRRLAETAAPHLHFLSLLGTNLTGHGLRTLLESRRHAGLRSLRVNLGLMFRREAGKDQLERELSGLPLLESVDCLRIQQIALDPAGLAWLLRSPIGQNLARLELPSCHLGEQTSEVLAEMALPHLRSLDLQGNNLRDRGVRPLIRASWLSHLEELNLANNAVGGPGLRALLGPEGATGLLRLNLDNNHVGGNGAEILARSETPRRLTWLHLGNDNLNPEAARMLVASPALSRLRCLFLNCNRISDEGVRFVAESPHLPRLRQLHLDNADVDSPGAESLLDTPHLRNVTRLSLRNAFITSNERERLRARFGAASQF